MNLGYVIVYVPEVEPALVFYEQAFGFKRRFLEGAGRYGELDTGATVLAFASESLGRENGVTVRPNRADGEAAGIEIAFVVDDVAAAVQRAVDAGAHLVKPASKKPWGQIVAYVRDRNGVLIELCTPAGG